MGEEPDGAIHAPWCAAGPRPFNAGLKIRFVDAGDLASFSSGLRGRGANSPPQFGHRFRRMLLAQGRSSSTLFRLLVDGDRGTDERLERSRVGLLPLAD